jgi:predicted Zn-dependent peptidase
VQKRGLTGDVSSTLNALGTMFDINGPTLYTVWLFHDKDKTDDEIIKAIDDNVTRLQTQPVDPATLQRARVKMRSELYNEIEALFGFGRADLLACFALFDDDPSKINRIEDEFARVTPDLIQRTAQEYLRTTNRTILTVIPKGQ